MPNYSQISPIFRKGDIKFYWKLHCTRMQQLGKKPVTYARFWDRLQRGWILKKAIYTPNTKPYVRDTSIGKNSWREFIYDTLGVDENIDIAKPLDDLLIMNKVKIPKPKPTLWERIKKRLKIN